ncbi:MAG: hypothetical protein ACNA7V_06590 [Bacteroidales bacterium]
MVRFRILLTFILFCIIFHPTDAVTSVDSLKILEEALYQDYKYDRLTMKERTWIRLVELDRKANELIEMNRLIFEELYDLSKREKIDFLEHINIISMEKALVEREMEIQVIALDRKIKFQKTLVMGSILVGTLFIFTLILLLSFRKRYKSARRELERLYSSAEEPTRTNIQTQVKRLTNNKLNVMKENNAKLKKELTRVSDEKSEAVEALKKEIRDRKKMEEEIKNLIEQIRKQ